MENETTVLKKRPDLRDYVAVIGIDWADEKHALATVVAPFESAAEPELSTLEQDPVALCEWIGALQKRFEGGRIAIALEQRKGALIHFLSAFEFLDIYPIEPVSLKNYRKALFPSGAQSDPVDATLLVHFLIKHQERLRCYAAASAPVRQLAQYCEDRRRFVDQRARALQCLGASLKMYFPLVLKLFDDLFGELAGRFLERWPTFKELKGARAATLRSFFYRHGSRSKELVERRIELIAAARPLTEDVGVIEPQALRVKSLVQEMTTLSRIIADYEKQIEKLIKTVDADNVFVSFPGAGKCLAPRLAVLFGDDRDRFKGCAEVQMFTGAAPVTQQSGKKKIVTMRWACSTFQRQSVVEYARNSLRYSDWARAFFDLHMPKDPQADKPTYTVLRKLGFKWLRILYRCWQTRTPYDEAKYLESLHRAGSPIWHRVQEMKATPAAA